MSEFQAALAAVRDHYKDNIRNERKRRYRPAAEHAKFYANDNGRKIGESGSDAIAGLELLGQSLGRADADQTEGSITESTQTLKADNNTPEAQAAFRKKVADAREKAKERAIESVDKVYDEALKIGEANPEYQESVLATAELVNALFYDLFDKVASYVSEIVQQLVEWVKKAFESIKNTFNTIGTWISNWF